jgi:hypothetical protein
VLKKDVVLSNRLLSDFIVGSVSGSSSVVVGSSPVAEVVGFGGLNEGKLSGGLVNDYDFVMSKCVVDKAWKPDSLRLPEPFVEYNGWKPFVKGEFVSGLSDVTAYHGQLCCAVCGVPLMDLSWRSDDAVGLKPTCFKCLGVVDVAKTCFSCGKVLSVSEFAMNYEGGYLAVDFRCFACVVLVPRVRNVLFFSRLLVGDGHVCMRCCSSPAFFKSGSGYFCLDCFQVLRDVAVMDDCVFVECWLG